jgi:hypothetical protein
MSTHVVRHEPGVASRRFGYAVAIGINLLLLYLVNGSPGWQAVPFLTDGMLLVLGVVNASFVAGIVANAIYVLADPKWLRALGDAVTTSIGLAAMVRLWTVWPFDFAAATVDWERVTRIVLGLGIVGSAVAIVVALVRLGRECIQPRR